MIRSLAHSLPAALLLATCAPAVAVEESGAPDTATLTVEPGVGFDTDYIFRGERLFAESIWGQVALSVPLTRTVSLSLTPWYLEAVEGDYSEFDLTASLNWQVGGAEISAGYAGYTYPRGGLGGGEGIRQEQEGTLSISMEAGGLTFSLLGAYNFDRAGYYLEAGVSHSLELGKKVALETSVALGYGQHYFAVDGFTHLLPRVALPFQLSEALVFTPYIAVNVPRQAMEDLQNAQVFGGISLTHTF